MSLYFTISQTIKANYSTGKYLLALKSLLALHAIDPQNPTLHVQSYRFRDELDHSPDGKSPKSSEIIAAETKTLLPEDKDLSDWNNDFLDRHKSSVSHVQAGLSVRALIGKEKKETNESDLFELLSIDSASINEASAGLDLLDEWSSSLEVKDRYRKSAAGRWNKASCFQANHIDTE